MTRSELWVSQSSETIIEISIEIIRAILALLLAVVC